MPYILDIPDHIADYLEGLSPSPHAREMIAQALEAVENLSGEFRANAANRIPGSTLLRYVRSFTDGNQRLHALTLAIDDQPAIYGILRIPHARYSVSDPFLPPPE